MLLEQFEARAIYEDRLRDAALERRARLVRAHQAQTQPNSHYFSHLKARVGDNLIALGHRLKREATLWHPLTFHVARYAQPMHTPACISQ